jgi:hypothetical protein
VGTAAERERSVTGQTDDSDVYELRGVLLHKGMCDKI